MTPPLTNARPDGSAADYRARIFQCLASPVRILILSVLADGEKNVNTIWRGLGLDQSLVSHHLIKMQNRGVLSCRRAGKQIFYRISDQVRIDTTGGGMSVYVYPQPGKEVANG